MRPKLSLRARPFSKNLVAFHQRCGERKSDHFLRRHVRLRKYRSACKRARRPPPAEGACVAVRPQHPCQKVILFDRLKAPEAFASGASFTGYTDIQPGSALAIASTISFAFSSPQRSRMSEARSRPIWMGPLNSVKLLYPLRQISNAVPHNRRHRMVGIAGYR